MSLESEEESSEAKNNKGERILRIRADRGTAVAKCSYRKDMN